MFQDHNMMQEVFPVLLIIGSVCLLIHAEPSPEPIRVHHESDHYHYVENDDRDSGHEESKVVQDVFSPDYAERTIVLDYRYLKTGGREYARSDGGQILILPKRKHGPPIMHNNFDELLELQRKKRLAELHHLLNDHYSYHKTDTGFEMRPEYTEVIEGKHDREHSSQSHAVFKA